MLAHVYVAVENVAHCIVGIVFYMVVYHVIELVDDHLILLFMPALVLLSDVILPAENKFSQSLFVHTVPSPVVVYKIHQQTR